jgi:arginase
MNRRDFMVGAGASMGTIWPKSKILMASATVAPGADGQASNPTGRTFHILGVPLRTGSLYPGNESDAQAYRDVKLLARLRAVGCQAFDDGDVAIPSYVPHHSIPPIRSWPGPRIAWDLVSERISPYLTGTGSVVDRL